MSFPNDENEREIELNSYVKHAWFELQIAKNLASGRIEEPEIVALYDAIVSYLKTRDIRKYGERELLNK